jgi:DNA invertase Pin-like site-specific DNA recombinase
MTPASNTPAVLYLRVSSEKQGESGLGLEAQEAACRRECERRGCDIVEVVTEVQSAKVDSRPLFTRACERTRELGGVLVTAEASRLSRGKTAHILGLYEQAAKDGYAIYALDLPEIDITSPSGELMLTLLAAINRFERRIIGQRTSRALQAKAARGEPVGRPRALPDSTVARVQSLRAKGTSYQGIADVLNGEGVPTFSGGDWRKEYVFQLVKRYGTSVPAKHGEG